MSRARGQTRGVEEKTGEMGKGPKTDPEALEAELERNVTLRLWLDWRECNDTYFGGALRPPQICLSDTERRLGMWDGRSRTLSIARRAALEQPWLATVEILKHEMVHQFVDEVLGGESRPHGPMFVDACRARGIDPAATTTARAPEQAAGDETDRIVARVRKLLALATSSNQNEAELAAATAQRLMLKHNVKVRARTEQDPGRFVFRHLGEPTGRVQAHQRALASLLLSHYFVDGIWVRTYDPRTDKAGTVLEICGRPENVEMAEFVHDFVARTAASLWEAHKAAQSIRGNRDRRSFILGAISGFHEKLDRQRAEHRREGLVWRGDAGVKSYMRKRHPYTRTVRRTGPSVGLAYQDGREAGKNIVLRDPVRGTQGSGRRPKALGPGRS